MKVKIEDFLLAMGEYCKEHDVGECCPEKGGSTDEKRNII